jgi:hypothetical protein
MLIATLHRPHPADDVHVTGTFDDWAKTEKLEKVGDVFEKEVQLPSADEKYYYKVRCLLCCSPLLPLLTLLFLLYLRFATGC